MITPIVPVLVVLAARMPARYAPCWLEVVMFEQRARRQQRRDVVGDHRDLVLLRDLLGLRVVAGRVRDDQAVMPERQLAQHRGRVVVADVLDDLDGLDPVGLAAVLRPATPWAFQP